MQNSKLKKPSDDNIGEIWMSFVLLYKKKDTLHGKKKKLIYKLVFIKTKLLSLLKKLKEWEDKSNTERKYTCQHMLYLFDYSHSNRWSQI